MSRRHSFLSGLVLLAWCSPIFAQAPVGTAAPTDEPFFEVRVTVVEVSLTQLQQWSTELIHEWETFRPPTAPLFVVRTNDPYELEKCLNKLRSAGIARTLADPKFVARNGQPASNKLPGEPKPTASYQAHMTVIPTASEKGKILLDVDVDVCSVDSMGGRRTGAVHTSLELDNDELGGVGLGSHPTEVVTKRKIWLLGYLPGVGRLFTREHQEEETLEFIALFRAKRVEALSGSPCGKSPAGN